MVMQIELAVMMAKIGFVLLILLHVAPIMLWVERRGSALLQNRLGPNRVGPLGLFQAVADALKFIFKEDRVPGNVQKFYFWIAPAIAVIPAFMTFAVIPFAGPIEWEGLKITFQLADLNVGILYIFAIGSLGVYGIIIAGWSSNSKYALFGSLRSTAQMVSYELSLTLSVIGMLLICSTLELQPIVEHQMEPLFSFGPVTIPRWGIFLQPLGFLIFLIAIYAETNRLPFDLPEGESEIVAGYHLEYGAMKFALFFMAEYLSMTTLSALTVVLFFGGWQMLPGLAFLITPLENMGLNAIWAQVLLEVVSFFTKLGFFMWLFVWVRWTLPRFRYDQLMHLGWKVLLPLSLVNIFVTSVLIFYGVL